MSKLQEDFENKRRERLKEGFGELRNLLRALHVREDEVFVVQKQIRELERGLRSMAASPALYEEMYEEILKTVPPRKRGSGRPPRKPLAEEA